MNSGFLIRQQYPTCSLASPFVAVLFDLFAYGEIFPILEIPTSSEVVMPSVDGAFAARAVFEIVDGLAFDDVAADFAADGVLDDSCFFHGIPSRFPRTCHHVFIKKKRSQTTSQGYLLLI